MKLPGSVSFERATSEALSLWITGGLKKDCLAGGRQILAVSQEGFVLSRKYHVEVEYRTDLALDRFFLSQSGKLATLWLRTVSEAKNNNRQPMLIVGPPPVMLISRIGQVDTISRGTSPNHAHLRGLLRCEVYLLDDVLLRQFTGDTGARE